MIDLRGRRALVTGASKGIGRACAIALARAGADVAVAFREDAQGAEETARLAGCHGVRAIVVQGDLRRWGDCEQAVARTIEGLGGLDVLVVNHGIWTGAPISEMRESDYDEMFDANVRGAFALCGAAVRQMRAQGRGGRIVTIASTAGQRGEALHSHYAASKGAIISLTKSLAAELAKDAILVNCVAPGWVDTPMTAGVLASSTESAEVLATIPLGRVGTADEIAGPVVFLASPLASFVTGEILNVNGGAVLCG